MKKTIAILVILGFALLLSCSNPNNNTQEKPIYEEEGTIGEVGGTVQVTDPQNNLNGTIVNIPENAVNGEIEISIDEVTDVDSLQTSMIDTTAVIVDFQPSGYQFDQPVEIGIPYTDNVDLETIQIYTFDEENEMWIAIPPDHIDTENKIVYTYTDHFSWYVSGDYASHYDVDLYRVGANRLAFTVQTENLENIYSNIQNGYLNMLKILEYHEIYDFFVWFKITVKEDTWFFPDTYQYDWHYFSGTAGATYMFDPKICRKNDGTIWTNGQATYAYDSQIAKEFFRGDAYVFISDELPVTDDIYIDVAHIFSSTSDPNNANNIYLRYSDNYGFGIRNIDLNDLDELPTSIDYNQNGITNQFDPYCEPEVTIETPTGVQSGEITINYTVTDGDGSDNTFGIYYQANSVGTNQATLTYTSEGSIYNGSFIQNVSPGNHYCVWDSDQDYPNNHCTDMTIRMSWIKDDGGSQLAAVSDQFEVDNTPKYITVTSPNGGETWQMGTSHNITWDDNISSNVKIELYKSGSFYETIKSTTASDGSYNWPIPEDLTESSSYKIKITSTSNSSVNDQSNNYFTIEEEPPADYITVTSPNGGETWQMGSTYEITWNDNIDENVKLELYKSGSFDSEIEYSTPSDGSFSWSIPTTLTESSNYKIKITSTSNSSINDYSDDNFTIQQGGGTGTVTDIDGNVYQTIIIGNQEWMMENLKVTHYRNGDPIPNLTNNNDWTSTSSGAYCYYDNDPSNAATYGALYNWYAVDDSRNIAPVGWHVPTDDEIKELEMYLGMTQAQADDTGYRGTNEGSKLAGNASLWYDGALENNSEFGTSGFTALPGGYRYYYYGFYGIGGSAYFWSSTEYSSIYAWHRKLYYYYSGVYRYYHNKKGGFSIRCLRD